MNKPIFTYLLGAGASYNVLPLVKDFPDRLEQFRVFLKGYFPNNLINDQVILERGINAQKTFYQDLQWLINNSKNHASIDTFAKKLYLTTEFDLLLKLKALVDIFFSIEQFTKGIDLRYDAFFAALIDEKDYAIVIPDNIRIITWNYDLQLELSLGTFLQTLDTRQLDDRIKISPSISKIPFNNDEFSIIKLNGTALGFLYGDNKFHKKTINPTEYNLTLPDEKLRELVKELISNYFQNVYLASPDKVQFPMIQYSWEKDDVSILSRQRAQEVLKHTDYLIIIGYSFPTFNRELDRRLLNSMNKPKKVFIQSPENNIDGVVQRFESLYSDASSVIVKKITQVDEFYIPFEYK